MTASSQRGGTVNADIVAQRVPRCHRAQIVQAGYRYATAAPFGITAGITMSVAPSVVLINRPADA